MSPSRHLSLFVGEIPACQVVFKASGISSAVVPPKAVPKIRHTLISTTENGVSTNETHLDAVKELMPT